MTMQFARTGTDGLENPRIFTTPEVTQARGHQSMPWPRSDSLQNCWVEMKERIFAL